MMGRGNPYIGGGRVASSVATGKKVISTQGKLRLVFPGMKSDERHRNALSSTVHGAASD